VHRACARCEGAGARTLELLDQVGIRDPESRLPPIRTSFPAASASA
jgi:ABC-type microcin C transport system duplicated ATPase subunit YejF